MPDTHDRGPARRGQRDPELALALEAELASENTAKGEHSESSTALLTGDSIVCKVTHEVQFDKGSPSWFTYGVSSQVQPGENDVDAFERVVSHVNDAVLDLIGDSEERLTLYRTARAEREAELIQASTQRTRR